MKRAIQIMIVVMMLLVMLPSVALAEDEDITLPLANSATVLTESVEKGGTISVSLDVTEEGSGIAELEIVLYAFNGDAQRYISSNIIRYTEPQFSGTLTVDIEVPLNAFAGSYFIGSINIADQAGNQNYYANSAIQDGYLNDGESNYIPLYSNHDIRCVVTGAGRTSVISTGDEDITLPLANSATVLTESVEKGGTISVSLDVTEEGSGIAELEIVLYAFNGDAQRYISSNIIRYTEPQFSGTLTVDIEVPLNAFAGSYFIGSINIADQAGNQNYYANSAIQDGYLNDGESNYIPLYSNHDIRCVVTGAGRTSVISTGDEDITLPLANNVTVLTDRVGKPGTISVSLDVTEEGSGIAELEIVLYAFNGDAQRYISSNIIRYTEPQFSGTLTVDIEVPLNAFAGSYFIGSINIADQAGNQNYYANSAIQDGYLNDGESNYIPLYSNHDIRCVVNNEGRISVEYDYDVDVVAEDSDSDLIQQINDMEEGKAAMVFVDFASHDTCTKEMLDAINGKDKTIVFYYNGIQWAFNGLDIVNETKDVHLTVEIEREPGDEYGFDTDVLKVVFYANGELPGPVSIRLQSDDISDVNDVTGEMYLFYLEDGTPTPEDSDVDYFVNGYDDWCKFNVEHNSTFIISSDDEMTSLSISAPDEVSSGSCFSVEFKVFDIRDLYGTSIDMVYDPEVVRIDDVLLAEVFGGETVSELVSDIDNEAGTMSYAWSLTGDVNGIDISERKTLITIECTALNQADTSWDIGVINSQTQTLSVDGDNTRILLSDSNAASIEVDEPTASIVMDKNYSDEIIEGQLNRTYYNDDESIDRIEIYYGADDSSIIQKINYYTNGIRTSYSEYNASGTITKKTILYTSGVKKEAWFYAAGIKYAISEYNTSGTITKKTFIRSDGVKEEAWFYAAGIKYAISEYNTSGTITEKTFIRSDGVKEEAWFYAAGIKYAISEYNTSGTITKKTFIRSDGVKEEAWFYAAGIKYAISEYNTSGTITEKTFIRSDGVKEEAWFYAAGIKYAISEYNTSGTITKKTFIRSDGVKEEAWFYAAGIKYAISEYNTSGTITKKTFIRSNGVKEEAWFYAAGIKYAISEYNTSGTITKKTFIRSNGVKEEAWFYAAGIKYATSEYNTSGVITKKTYLYSSGIRKKVYWYSSTTGLRYAISEYDTDGDITKKTYLNSSGVRKIIYWYSSITGNKYAKSYYNTDGDITKKIYYNEDGSVKETVYY